MKRKFIIPILTIITFSFHHTFGQPVPFDELNAKPGSQKHIEWLTSDYEKGFGHKIYNNDPGGKTLLTFAGRHNSTTWSDILTLTSDGKVGIGTLDPSSKFQVNGNTNLLGNVTSSSTQWIINNNSHETSTLWLTNPSSGPTVVGHYYIKAFDWWSAYLHFQGSGDDGNEKLNVTFDGKVGIGVENPVSKLHVHEEEQLGSNVNDTKLITRVSGRTGNFMMNNLWLRRDDTGDNWFTARLHDGVSVDGSFLSPGTDTRTWWERDAYNDIQSWGNAASAYMTLRAGKLGIGTTNPDEKLTVKGAIHAEEVRCDLSVPGPDYVFEADYDLKSLEEIEQYIQAEKHLPEIPSAKEMEENGVELGEMNMLLLKKIEELTLHLIQSNKEKAEMREQLMENSRKLEMQGKMIEELKSE